MGILWQNGKKYYTGNERIGKYVKGIGSHGSVDPQKPLPSQNGSHIPKTAPPVTFIHTHTPLTYESDCKRAVGISAGDITFANENKIGIILIDYVGSKGDDGKNYIYGGHNIDDATKEYNYIPSK